MSERWTLDELFKERKLINLWDKEDIWTDEDEDLNKRRDKQCLKIRIAYAMINNIQICVK